MRRRDGDLMFREQCLQERTSISFEHQIIQAKASLETAKERIEQDHHKQQEKNFSLSM